MGAFSSPAFKKLQAKYYARLKDVGFRDIENKHGDLIDHQSVIDFGQRIGFRSELIDNIRDYFTWASSMVWHGRFENKRDRRIWALHAEGKSYREIADIVPLSQQWIGRSIKRIRESLRRQNGDSE